MSECWISGVRLDAGYRGATRLYQAPHLVPDLQHPELRVVRRAGDTEGQTVAETAGN